MTFVSETKISDEVMFFNGDKVDLKKEANSTAGYDYVYGNALTPHGDCVKAYKQFVFMTWYRGGKEDRHVMLTRLNTETGTLKTIEFPHQHTGYNGKWWIGESHNTIAVGISPINETVHLLYDMHRNGRVPEFENDYLRYSYSVAGAATVSDEEFTLDQFVDSSAGNFKHLAFPGIDDEVTTKLLTYPAFFTNDEGDLFMKMRFGYSENGKFLFARYDGEKWHGYHEFNRMLASDYGSEYNWGLYGDFKYLNGKFRIGFQRRLNNRQDRYQYQNGIYYAYSDDQRGVSEWKDANGNAISTPLVESDLIKIAEPGDWVETMQKNGVHIVSGFDFTVTEAGDEHFVSLVTDKEANISKKLHTYRTAGESDFTTVEYDAGNALFTSGTDVFVIGLKNGRVNVVKTKGGTSDFQEVYQHDSGPTFDKGVLNVRDGIAYYYLKQASGSGDKRSVYLQIFDLGTIQ